MRHVLWALAVATLAVQAALAVFGGAVERALFGAHWPLALSSLALSMAVTALIILTAGAGIYAAGRAQRGGWVALFAVALVLSIYGSFVAYFAAPYLGLARVGVVYFMVLDIALEVLVPLLVLIYVLRFHTVRPASAAGA